MRTPACFNSLQTGKCIARKRSQPSDSPPKRSFNSLQTGKCIASARGTDMVKHQQSERKFQFPSNGKVHCKFRDSCDSDCNSGNVSIPFKRESALQVSRFHRINCHYNCFNSLQTGKCIARDVIENFFQINMIVSIPFKRESALQELFLSLASVSVSAFQFPSNGKVHCKSSY